MFAFLRIGAQLAFRLWARTRFLRALSDETPKISKAVTTLGRIKVDVRLVSNRFPWAKQKMHEALEGALEAAADTAVRSAKRRAPVQTGRLRNSIQRTDVRRTGLFGGGGYEVAIFTDVPYAVRVEYGSVHAPAQSFLRPAARAGGKKVAREVKARFPKR